jgi:hypothetical protein
MCNRYLFFALCLLNFSLSAEAQMSSQGPGKGPPSPGMGSKYTYPQPKKITTVSPESVNPAAQVPEFPERSLWRLTNKLFATGSNPNDVPVYMFDSLSGRRTLVGMASVGDEVVIEEIRLAARRIHYKFNWSGGPAYAKKTGGKPEFWVDGINVEYAGKK